jgi:hypothetical protein
MTYEDFSTYTVVLDSGWATGVDKWVIDTPGLKCTGSALDIKDNTYVYKDFGVDFFEDVTYYLDVSMGLATGSPSFNVHGFWGISNDLNAWNSMANGLVVYGTISNNISGAKWKLNIYDKGNSNSDAQSTENNAGDILYLIVSRVGTTATCKIYPTNADRSNNTNIIDTLTLTCLTTKYRYLYAGFSHDKSSGLSSLTSYVENVAPLLEVRLDDTIQFSDEIFTNIPQETQKLADSITFADTITFAKEVFPEDTMILSDEIELNVSREKSILDDTITFSDEIATGTVIDIDNDFRMSIELRYDIDNKINTVIERRADINSKINTAKLVLEDVDNKFNSAIQNLSDIGSVFNSVKGETEDVDNDFRASILSRNNISNDFRMSLDWQKAGGAGVQSLGKSYIKVYFDSVEQTDVDVDSISIEKPLNASHTATLILGRPYDNSKPDLEATVEIKYNDILIYKGYITTIRPASNPENMRIECNNIYWKNNREKVWFNVGHKPGDDTELYYTTIKSALSSLGIGWNVGNFIPQTMSIFGESESDAITNLVTNTGNFGWYYTENEVKKLWTGGGGSIVNLEKQEIGKNLGLYQVLNHTISETSENLVNKLRVQMGDEVFKVLGDGSENKEYQNRYLGVQRVTAIPAWNASLETPAKDSSSGFGFDYHPDGSDYADVYKKFKFPRPTILSEEWTDRKAPVVEIKPSAFGGASIPTGQDGILSEGFSVDFENGILTLGEKFYYYAKDDKGRITKRSAPHVTLIMYKLKKISNTENDGQDPANDITNELMFFTDKVGDYSETVLDVLNLGGLSIQNGGVYITLDGDDNRIIHYVPSWNDQPFAEDIAYWHLSQTAYPKVSGTVELTLDAMLFYNLDLGKRIMIAGIIESPLNITDINYNLQTFTVTLSVENFTFYKRSVSRPSHGEGMTG